MLNIVFLGSGTSTGVPMIGCSCPVCTSTDPRNNRLRSSIFVKTDSGFHILVDTTPDLRQQALRYGITRVDAVLFTHAHADHVFGMDDLRRFNRGKNHALPCYGDRTTIAAIETVFAYSMNHNSGGLLPLVDARVVDRPVELGGVDVVPVRLDHGPHSATGYRIGPVAYLTDCDGIPAESMDLVRDLDLLIIDALRYRPHPTHFTIPQALDVIEQLDPRRALLTHLSHDIDHETVSRSLPPRVGLAYDGLEIVVDRETTE